VRELDGLYALVATNPSLARRVASQLEVATRADDAPAPEASLLTPILFRTSVRSNVRSGPSQEHGLLGTVTDGALLVGLRGTLGDRASGLDETEGWVRVFASAALDGWMARRLLVADDRCAPRVGSFEPEETLARVELSEGGERYSAFLGVEPRAARLYQTDTQCNLTLRHLVRTGGSIGDSFVTAVADDGDSVLVLGEWPDGRVSADGAKRWSARLVAEPETIVWERTLASGQNLPDARREGLGGPFSRGPSGVEGFFPLRIRGVHTRTWLVWDAATRTFVSAEEDVSAGATGD